MKLRKAWHSIQSWFVAIDPDAHPVIDCPSCGSRMRVEAHSGIVIDRCLRCQGIWFDAGELRALLERARDRQALSPESWVLQTEVAHNVSRLPCPHCHHREPMRWQAARGVPAQSCRGCRGIFLPRESLYSLARRKADRTAEKLERERDRAIERRRAGRPKSHSNETNWRSMGSASTGDEWEVGLATAEILGHALLFLLDCGGDILSDLN